MGTESIEPVCCTWRALAPKGNDSELTGNLLQSRCQGKKSLCSLAAVGWQLDGSWTGLGHHSADEHSAQHRAPGSPTDRTWSPDNPGQAQGLRAKLLMQKSGGKVSWAW